ncbi:MAG: phosphotyrosine protein phosphatase [Deinococcales bacterium]
MRRVLFVCTQNKLRSATAEQIFFGRPGFEVASAGTAPSANVPLSAEHIDWADTIFVMEKAHRNRIQKKFKPQLKNKRLVVLNIPDEFDYMDPVLVRLLEARVGYYFQQFEIRLENPS